MNFEFLKDLDLIGGIYKTCKNAEDLVNSKPDSSMVAARKGAENLAKLAYMHAHTDELQNLSFLDILNDSDVRKFLDGRAILNAFHDIRKKGNKAAHAIEDEDNNEEALSLLNELHYIAGEMACKMGLIEGYPPFNDDIEIHPEADYHEDENESAFLRAVRQANEEAFESFKTNWREIPWCGKDEMELREQLTFETKPRHQFIYTYLQTYFAYLLSIAKERVIKKGTNTWPLVTVEATLTLNDERKFSADNPDAFMEALLNDLPDADSFSIDGFYTGTLGIQPENSMVEDWLQEYVNSKDFIWTGGGMYDWIRYVSQMENNFIYKKISYYPDFDECSYDRVPELRSPYYDIRTFATKDSLLKKSKGNWYTGGLCIGVNFDFEKHKDILDKLQEAVRAYIPKDELDCTVKWWKEGDYESLVTDAQWFLEDLAIAQDFFDTLNSIIAPIKDKCNCRVIRDWQDWDQFGIGVTEWTKEEGFQVKVVWY